MKLNEIIKIIEKEYPPELAYEWDNSGLFFGDLQKEISCVLVTLDVTPEIINEAIENKAELILSHHPVLMDGVKTLSDNSMQSEMLLSLVKNDIAVYSAHTNMDTAAFGINQKLAELFELCDIVVMENDKPYPDCGLGRVGNLKTKMRLFDFCEVVKEKLNTPFVRVSGEDREINRVAFASGSCGEYIPSAIKKGAKVIVTADIKYHHAIEYVHDGIAIIDAGHYPTEIIVMDMFNDLLKDLDVKVIYSKNQDIFKVR